ncbi:cobalt/nickel ECF transporter CbiMNQO, A component, ATP-binding protein CbiO [Campylobacter blaseri]|uniref:Cobalt ABC transporter ATP-binding protein n=1 Tax=Campylobacter blaseri TaxID=2042961 RepID=A0A2P8R0U4_9BACT|nr:ABC transporter ATP-binding protein [Campylobacter blaseri]PSM52116.1 cobalt ABC transporter ATP-binding protein [Campylobacter blaseri]PSM53882.1 cobalt ABC transporter ATP-binding protein [Campylobacter blaseri]QKF85316.1 cobalt/nickel ECF transporter CbiMNQO, A component, ATP-binding protein CbiO [Campylobacter blaseri]
MSCSVSLKNISAKNGEKEIFRNVNLQISHKEKIAIIGSNGCGKTTLLEIIGGLRGPSGGEIEIFHEKIPSLDEYQKYRYLVGYLFQNSDDQFIFPNVFEDVMFGLLNSGVSREEAKKRVEFILKELDIWHLKDKIVFHLSGGEKKIVAIAGVLVTMPKIILLDEPTTGLDFKMQEKVANIIKNLDLSVIIVSHDKKFLGDIVDTIYYLNKDGLEK